MLQTAGQHDCGGAWRWGTANASARVIVAACIVAAAAAAGCKSSDTLRRVGDAYNRGDYKVAYRDGTRLARHGKPGQRREAAYLAGLAAYRLKHFKSAQRLLTTVAGGDEPQIAGGALVTLGLIYSESGRHAAAVKAFVRGARKLSGEDSALAYFHASTAAARQQRWTEQRTYLNLARSASRDSKLRRQIDQQLAAARR